MVRHLPLTFSTCLLSYKALFCTYSVQAEELDAFQQVLVSDVYVSADFGIAEEKKWFCYYRYVAVAPLVVTCSSGIIDPSLNMDLLQALCSIKPPLSTHQYH